MVTYVFGVEGLARTRFAISPMWETMASLRALQDPSTAALHLPWIDAVREPLRGLDLRPVLTLVPAQGYLPDFLSPPPSGPQAGFEEELALVAQTPSRQLRREVGVLLSHGTRSPEALDPYLRSPRRALRRIVDAVAAYWEVAIEPHWSRVHALLEAEVLHRARRLADAGPSGLFADLHPTVRWVGERLEVQQIYQGEVKLDHRGLLLVPTAFHWQRPATITDPPWQPTLIYPARGVATLWEPGESAPPAWPG